VRGQLSVEYYNSRRSDRYLLGILISYDLIFFIPLWCLFFFSLTNQIKEVQSENVDLSAVITILIQLKQKVLFILLDLEVYAFMMVALFIYFEVNFAMKNLSN
ncbi:MAG: hypothetical protein ACK56I_18320, partial [bacterium]